MCAIAGLIGLYTNEIIIKTMDETMRRRGPDANGKYETQGCALLHSRLSIVDIEGGKQPMEFKWNGDKYIITYNGELYNTEEIRRELIMLGHSFLGHSDTEVVLHAYAQWKEECLHKLNGIFAFGVWEEQRKRLFLARDRMGVKPLFYKLHNDGLIFASEIKTILAYPTVEAQIDANGAAEVILLGPGRTPGSGIFRNINELEPGCCGYYEKGKWRWIQYWKLLDKEHTDTFEQTKEKVRYLVTDAIRRQMVSDVPIGTFLSGGLDSSLISAVCAQEMKSRGLTLDTFSVGYVDNDKYFVPNKFQPNSDNRFIRIMEEHLASDHHWTVLKTEELIHALEDATYARDLPGMADVDFSLLCFCKEIRPHVKVALSGECADEIFGGYPWYRDPQVRSAEGFPWAQNTQYRASFLHPQIANKIDAESFVMDRYHQTIRESDINSNNSPSERRMKEMVNLNHRWFMQTLLDRKDRMSMFCGLEVRVPFCDYRIAEYLYSVPWEMKDYDGYEKGLLRQAMEGYLPKEVMWRKKSPYPKTWDPKYKDLVCGCMTQMLRKNDEPIFQLVRKDALVALMDSDPQWPWYGQLMRTPQTIAYMLQINYWLKMHNISLVNV